jgi:dTDP-4-amino-4,6-dideoxygalactose transaminase
VRDPPARTHDQRPQPYHLLYLVTASRDRRTLLIARGILAVLHHYLSLDSPRWASAPAARPNDCPVTEDLSDRVLRLSSCNDLDEGSRPT